jgi:phage FluMu protein gp41
MADIQVANTDADLSGNTVVTEENAYTITGLHTYSRSTSPPFAVNSGAAVVANLDADKLDGIEATGFVKANGTVALTANWDAGGYEIRAQTLESDVATGTAPLTIASTTKVANLNVDKLDDQEGSYYLAAANATGTLAVNRGGTGAATFTDGGILLGSGTSAITALGAASNGQIPIGDGSTDPVLATLTGTSNEVDIANGSGSITVGLPASVTVTTALTISGTGASALDVGGGINAGTGNVSLVGTDGKIEGPLSSTIIDDLSGANLTTLNASNISSGTLAAARLPAKVTVTSSDADALDVTGGLTIGSGDVALVGTDGKLSGPLSSTIIDDLSGANLTTLNAGSLSSGTVATARLGSGTASSDTFLRGDGSWAAAGGGAPAVLSKSADYTVATSDGDIVLVLGTTSGGNVTITLYASSGNSGNIVHVKKLLAANSLIIDGNSSETIDGATTQTITAQYTCLTLCCDGSNWHII